MHREAQVRLTKKYPGIINVLRDATKGGRLGRRGWQKVRSIREHPLTDHHLDRPFYHHTQYEWDDEKAEPGYVVRQIETTSHYIGVVYKGSPNVRFYYNFEYKTTYDPDRERLEDNELDEEPHWIPLRKLIPRLDQMECLIHVTKRETQWIEGMALVDHVEFTGKSWRPEISYDVEVLLPSQNEAAEVTQ